MSGLNLKALKTLQGDLEKKSGDGAGIYFYSKNLKKETDFRILPPLEKNNGIYFHELIKFWIGGKPYLSPATLERACPIMEEIESAEEWGKANKDKELMALLDDEENFKKSLEYQIPGLVLDCEFDDSGVVKSMEVRDDEAKVLVCGPKLMKTINRIVSNRMYQNGTLEGITHRVKGYNICLSRTGTTKFDTEYHAVAWPSPMEIDEKWYDEKKIPDIAGFIEKELDQEGYEDYLRGVIRNYLYGEPMPAALKKERGEAEAGAKKGKFAPPARGTSAKPEAQVASSPAPGRGQTAAAPAPTGRGAANTTAASRPAPPPARTAGPAATDKPAPASGRKAGAPSPARRSVVNDLDNTGETNDN